MWAPWLTTPRTARADSASRTQSCPATVAVPRVGRSSVATIFRSVVLPAPLGPSSAAASPAATSRLTPSRTRWAPKTRTRPTTRMSGTATMRRTDSFSPTTPRPSRKQARLCAPPFAAHHAPDDGQHGGHVDSAAHRPHDDAAPDLIVERAEPIDHALVCVERGRAGREQHAERAAGERGEDQIDDTSDGGRWRRRSGGGSD